MAQVLLDSLQWRDWHKKNQKEMQTQASASSVYAYN